MIESRDAFSRALRINASMTAASLVSAAHEAWDQATEQGAVLLATDVVGERILGAGLVLGLDDDVVADRHSRLDGQRVIMLAGAQAGPIGLSDAAKVARSLGASAVEAAVVGGWPCSIAGCDSIHRLAGGSAQSAPETTASHSAA